jgi:O-antigen ligase
LKALRIDRWLPIVADLAFGLYLTAEIIFSHSLISQICMLLLLGVIALYCIRRRRLYFSWWMAATLPFILWGAVVTRFWAVDAASSADMVKTLLINVVYFFFLFQYLILQGDMRRYMTVFSIVAIAVCLYALLRELPYDIHASRVGVAAGVNPNALGMIAAVAAGFCLVLARQKSAFWLLPLIILLPTVLLTKSIQAGIQMAVVVTATYLILFPKRWWLKLAAIFIFIAAMLAFVVYPKNPLSEGILSRVHEVLLYYLGESTSATSAVLRSGYISLAFKAFLIRPWSGYGLANFRLFDGADGTYTHNNYAELLVSGGVVMLVLYYLPLIIALALGVRALCRSYRKAEIGIETRERANLGLFMMLTISSLLMDYGTVSFFERNSAVIPLLLVAATRLLIRTNSDGTWFFSVLFKKNQKVILGE